MKNNKLQIELAVTTVLLFISKLLYAAVEVPDEELGYFIHAGRVFMKPDAYDYSDATTEETKRINDGQVLSTSSSLESSSQSTLFPSIPQTSSTSSPRVASSLSSQLPLSSSSPPTSSLSSSLLNPLFFKLRLSGLQKWNFPKLSFLSQTIPNGRAIVSRKSFKTPEFSHQRSNLEEQFPDNDRYTKHSAFSIAAPERFQGPEESSESAGTTRPQKDSKDVAKVRHDKRSYTCPMLFPSVFPVWHCLKYIQLIRKEIQRRKKLNNQLRTHKEVSRKFILRRPISWSWRFPFQDYTAFHLKLRNDIYG